MPNYQTGKIYQIVNDVNDILYIGSTTKHYLSDRMADHRSTAKNKITTFYAAMNEIGVQHFRIILIKLYPCGSRSELEAEEFATMKEIKDKGIELYNTVDGSPQSKPNFTRGHVSKSGSRWRYQWSVCGERMCKSFSISTWGSDWCAKKMAILWQNMTYPLEE